MGGRLNDIVILRSISILLVVFVHSFYIYNYGSLSDIDTIVIKIERFAIVRVRGAHADCQSAGCEQVA